MRFMSLGLALMAFKYAVSQEDLSEEAMDAEPVPKTVSLNVTYDILEREGPVDVSTFLEVQRPETFTLDYRIENIGEDDIYSVVGVSGSVVSAVDNSDAGALSPQNFEGIEVMPGKSSGLRQDIQLTMPSGRYFIVPYLHIQEDGQIKRVMVSPFAIEMMDPPMSTFDLSFLSVIAMVAALVGGVYYIYTNTVTPAPKLRKKDAVPVKVDESWLPDIHKK